MVQACGYDQEWKCHISQLHKRAAKDIFINQLITEDTLSSKHRALPIAHIGTGDPEICAHKQLNRLAEDAFVICS